jgi:hypothetical protein
MRAEIRKRWHTGKHVHGEEAIYVESGERFMILDDKRYNFCRFGGRGCGSWCAAGCRLGLCDLFNSA